MIVKYLKMMKIVKLFFAAIVLFTYSCTCTCTNKKLKEKSTFYEDGSIMQKMEYLSDFDTVNYRVIEFMKNGDTLLVCYFKNKIQHGPYFEYYPNNRIKVISSFTNNKEHGITCNFNQDGVLLDEVLNIKGNPIVQAAKDLIYDTLDVVNYYYTSLDSNNDTLQFFGSLVWDKEGKIVELFSNYFVVDAQKRIRAGDSLLIDIKFIMGLYKNLYFELRLGELDQNLEFIDSTKVVSYKSNGNDLRFDYSDYSIGQNLLMGKIKLYRTDIKGPIRLVKHPKINEYIFYHQFDVVE
jgi:hypothetical protein